MKYVLYKFVEAGTAADALALDVSTPVHEVSLKAGEQPGSDGYVSAIGFRVAPDEPLTHEMRHTGKRR
jgi:hypothetical protein